MREYLNDAVRLYFNELVDWDTFFRWTKGPDCNPQSERDALFSVVEWNS